MNAQYVILVIVIVITIILGVILGNSIYVDRMTNREKATIIKNNEPIFNEVKGFKDFKSILPEEDAVLFTDIKKLKQTKRDFSIDNIEKLIMG